MYKSTRKTKKKRKYTTGKPATAIAVLAENKDEVQGIIKFKEERNGVKITYNITGLTDGKHGFHIHEYGDLTEGCASACAHFNPYHKKHGGLHRKERHLGDLGNITSSNGLSKGYLFARDLTLVSNNTTSILGRMIIVHADADDLGKGGDLESTKTGNAGKRVACGVIGRAR